MLGFVGSELGGWIAFAFELSLGALLDEALEDELGLDGVTLPDEDIEPVVEVSLGDEDELDELLLGDVVSVDAVVVGGVAEAVDVVELGVDVLYEVEDGFLLQPGRTDAASAVMAM